MKRYKTVDAYIDDADYWQEELIRLREILNSTQLEEGVRWGGPCYLYKDKMVVGLGAFKSYVGLWFFQGALLADEGGVLINAQEGKTKAMRQWRFTSKKDIKVRLIKSYVKEAIALVDAGREIKPDRNQPVTIPPELKTALAKNKKAGSAFQTLTKGRQRDYANHIADAKRAETKARRIEKILPMIEEGIGLSDQYRNC